MQRALALAALALLGCLGRGSVTRVVDGQSREGRAIDDAAYAAYARAAFFAARGDREHALEELDRALDHDPLSPEILTRVGELRCGTNQPLGGPAPPSDEARAGLTAFTRALGLDASYAPAWLGRARCLERSGRRTEALAAAERAAHYDPLRVESTVTMARLLFAAGRAREAWQWLDGLALLDPDSVEIERARLAAAERQRAPRRIERSRRALAALGRSTPGSTRIALEQALARKDLAAARARALELRLSGAELALEAAKISPELALEQALSVLGADPSDSAAWIAALIAADRLGDDARFADALDELDVEPLSPTAPTLELLGELIARRAGPDSFETFRRAVESGEAPP
jgi:tetratricopeptide (TPR) repeat protein